MTKFNYAVFIGRFQPFHAGHYEVVKAALESAEILIMMIGSADSPRTEHNPWTYGERIAIIKAAVGDMIDQIRFRPANDYPYNDSRWVGEIVQNVKDVHQEEWTAVGRFHAGPKPKNPTVTLIGHKKDHTSYYLDMFPMWDSSGVPHHRDMSATDIRNALYIGDTSVMSPAAGFFLNDSHKEVVRQLIASNIFSEMQEEGKFIQKTKEMWANVPYPVTFVTVDAVVTCAHHVLVVKRRSAPGKGLLAMPGGYLDVHERIVDSMLRELNEETKIAVPKKVLRGSIKSSKVYDQVERSTRGRIITHAFHIDLALEPNGKLPKVKGSDDAEKAFWLSIGDLKDMKSKFFEDHIHIIDDILGGVV